MLAKDTNNNSCQIALFIKNFNKAQTYQSIEGTISAEDQEAEKYGGGDHSHENIDLVRESIIHGPKILASRQVGLSEITFFPNDIDLEVNEVYKTF